MEQFKRTLKIRIGLLGLMALTAGAVAVFSLSGRPGALPDFLWGFQLGAAAALTGAGTALAVWYSWILGNPERIRLQYNKEKDERMRAIKAKAGMPILYVTSVLMLLAGMVGGYWNPVIFYTLISAGELQLFASIVVMLVYSKIM